MTNAVRALALGIFVLVSPLPGAAGAAAAPQGAAPISAAEAAPFLGEWTMALQGPNGPGTFTVTVSAEKEKVTAEIVADAIGKQPITSIALVDKSLVLGYSFNYEGNAVDAVATLTPDKEGKTAAHMDFAGGAYTMTGTATRKDKPAAR